MLGARAITRSPLVGASASRARKLTGSAIRAPSRACSSRRDRMPTPRWLFQIPWRTRRQIHDDFEEELSFHHDMRIAELLAQGHTRAEAEAIVARERGDVDDARRYVRHADYAAESTQRRRDLMHETLNDLRTVARRLARTPAFTATALLTLALGVGACVLMFNIIAAVLIAPLPFKNADRIVMVWGDVPQVDLGF